MFYTYKASDAAGRIVKGTLEAADEGTAAGKLQDMGYIPIRISAGGGQKVALNLDLGRAFSTLFSRISGKDVMLFTQDLAALLEAGLPVDRSLSILSEVAENPRLQTVIGEILKAVQGGAYLSDAMAQHPRAFSDFYVNMIRAGEAGGVLEPVLVRLGTFLESAQELRDYIKSALIYPVFLLLVGGVSLIILLTFVIPKFAVIFSDMGQTIPWSTRFLLGTSQAFKSYWWAILLAGGLIGLGVRQYAASPGGRLAIDTYKLKLPLLGELVQKIEVARFARTLGTLINSGVPILQAIWLVRATIGNQVIAGSMTDVHQRVKEGDRLATPLAASRIFPSLAVQMITVGEETGRLDEMLLKVADNYEKVVRNQVRRLVNLLEPALILVMGLIVGFIVISMLMAIFSMNEMPF